jgi:hypothetical protein
MFKKKIKGVSVLGRLRQEIMNSWQGQPGLHSDTCASPTPKKLQRVYAILIFFNSLITFER